MSSSFGTDRQPVAITYQRLVIVSPSPVVIVQVDVASSHAAVRTGVEKRMSRRRSCLSATCWRYFRISGWVAYFSDHVHSVSSSGSHEYV